MLPARALSGSSASPALMLRHCVSGSRTGNVKLASSLVSSNRQFSQMRKLGSASPKQWNSNPSGSLRGQVSGMPRLASMKLSPASPNAFAQRAGATRALSLWPFSSGSKQQPPAAADPTSVPEATTANPSTPSLWDKLAPADATAAQASTAATPMPDATAATTGLPGSAPESSDFSSILPDSFDELGIQNILDMPERIGYLKDLGLDFGWGPTAMCEWLIEHLHVTAGLHWWGAIGAAALFIRLVMVWPSILGAKYSGRMQVLTKNPQPREEFKFAVSQGDQAAVMKHRTTVLRLQKAAGTSTIKAILPPLIAVPFSFGMFRLLRAMGQLPVPSLETGGIAWFTDLSVYDPTYVLPMATALLTVVMFRHQQRSTLHKTPQSEQMGKLFIYGMTPFMFLCTMWLPSALQWFFFTFSALTTAQNWVLIQPVVRRMTGLPPLPAKPTVMAASQYKRMGIGYQAPTRPAVVASQPPDSPEGPSVSGFKGMMEGATKQIQSVGDGLTNVIKDYSGGEKGIARKKAAEYEARRSREEKEKAARRLEEQRRRRKQV
ncbi:YidC/Oxa1 family membrane protein insertase [Apiospora phragmitis]|uniref:YidC/Oxa1 family membrane protein insertase n=1 Tax=Apiospora phragmitis TaxID=2905665 RepID=A0ABR1T6L3_9PEZI